MQFAAKGNAICIANSGDIFTEAGKMAGRSTDAFFSRGLQYRHTRFRGRFA
jgi:hypothetical protein